MRCSFRFLSFDLRTVFGSFFAFLVSLLIHQCAPVLPFSLQSMFCVRPWVDAVPWHLEVMVRSVSNTLAFGSATWHVPFKLLSHWALVKGWFRLKIWNHIHVSQILDGGGTKTCYSNIVFEIFKHRSFSPLVGGIFSILSSQDLGIAFVRCAAEWTRPLARWGETHPAASQLVAKSCGRPVGGLGMGMGCWYYITCCH